MDGRQMIIDAHCHLKHGDQQGTEYTPDRIVEIMDMASIEKSIVFAISTDTRKAHAMTLKAIRKFPDRLIGFAYAIPDFRYSVSEEIEHAVTDLGFRGIKIHGGQTPLRPQLGFIIDPVLELAGKLDVPCLIDFIGRFEDAQRIAERFPTVKVQVAHLGQYRCNSESVIDRFIGLAEKHENLVLDISGVTLTWKIWDAINANEGAFPRQVMELGRVFELETGVVENMIDNLGTDVGDGRVEFNTVISWADVYIKADLALFSSTCGERIGDRISVALPVVDFRTESVFKEIFKALEQKRAIAKHRRCGDSDVGFFALRFEVSIKFHCAILHLCRVRLRLLWKPCCSFQLALKKMFDRLPCYTCKTRVR